MKKRKTILGGGLFLLIGILLTALVIATGAHGLDPADRDIYQRALALDQTVDGFGFEDFSVAAYKIRISDGETDYVMWQGEAQEAPAAFDTLVATAQKLEGEYQVILPAYQGFADILGSVGTLGALSQGGADLSSENYSREAHAATLFHEAFHAWQFSRFESDITGYMAARVPEDTSPERLIVSQVDADAGHIQSLEKELQYLYAAVTAADQTAAVDWLRCGLEEEAARRRSLGEGAVAAEIYFEMVEGTAQYVESRAYLALTDEKSWAEAYLTEPAVSGGSGKYYTIGMLKCLLLDRLDPGWQQDFTLPCDLSEALSACLEGK